MGPMACHARAGGHYFAAWQRRFCPQFWFPSRDMLRLIAGSLGAPEKRLRSVPWAFGIKWRSSVLRAAFASLVLLPAPATVGLKTARGWQPPRKSNSFRKPWEGADWWPQDGAPNAALECEPGFISRRSDHDGLFRPAESEERFGPLPASTLRGGGQALHGRARGTVSS